MSNPYDQNPYAAGGGVPQPHPKGTTVLVMGIIGLVVCPILAVIALVQGNTALKEIDANPAAYNNRQSVVIGRILGIIAIALWVLWIIVVIILAVTGNLAEMYGM